MAEVDLTYDQIAEEAEKLRVQIQQNSAVPFTLSNYKSRIGDLVRIANNMAVLIREDAQRDAEGAKK